MKEKINRILKVIGMVIASFNALLFYSMRPNWSGISKTLGYTNGGSDFILNLPIVIFAIVCLVLALSVIFFIFQKKKNLWNYILLPLDVVLLGGNLFIFTSAKEYARYIFVNFAHTFVFVLLVSFLLFLVLKYPKTKLASSKVFKLSMLGIVLLGASAYVLNLQFNAITYEPVVYAVGNEYQIVFSSRVASQGTVQVDGVTYSDSHAGSIKSSERVHKVCVPMEKLDGAKGYTISVQRYIYRGPFGAIKGKEISKSYSFTPVDSSDGLTYYALSDIHLDEKGALSAIKMTEDFELLVLNGDITSDVETFHDANYVNKLAFEMTQGAKPVVYARGNHEVKGKYADQLYKFVGSVNEKYYYNFYLDGIYGMVLDLGEDHDDGWWEYYGSDDFTAYRDEQVAFVEQALAKKDYENYDYRLIVCHDPLAYVNTRGDHLDHKKAIVEKLNQMNVDMLLSGHQHQLYIFEPNLIAPETKLTFNQAYGGKAHNGQLTSFNFPSLIVSKHGYTQTDKTDKMNAMIGLTVKVDFKARKQTCYYNNVKREKVSLVNPFADRTYGDTITINLDTKEFAK